MSRNISFFILGLIAAALTYVFNPALPGLVEFLVSDRLPGDFIRLLRNSELIAFAGYISLFGLLFFLLYFIFPVSYTWYQINSAINIIDGLPPIHNPVRRTNKKAFLSALKSMGFIDRLATSYGPYLIQGPEEEVAKQKLKNTRIVQKMNNKNQKILIAPVRATAPAELVFNSGSLVNDNLLLGFFTVFSRILAGAGVIIFGISLVSFSLSPGTDGAMLLSALQPGIVGLLFCLIAAVIISGLTHLLHMILSQNSRSLARMINALFYQGDWPEDMAEKDQKNKEKPILEQLEASLKNSMDKPMKEISKAVKALSVDQEKKLDSLLSKTLTVFSNNLEKNIKADATALNKALKDAGHAADVMKKQFGEANVQFSKQMEKQTTAIAKHLADMQKILTNSEKVTLKGTEKIISTISSEIDGTYTRLGEFMENSLKKLEEKQATIETAVNDKDSILQDLHNTAKDLGTISNASGKLLEKFKLLASEMDVVLNNIQKGGFERNNGRSEQRDKLKSAMLELKKSNNERTSELPDM